VTGIETQEVAKEMIAFETARFESHQKQRKQVEDLVDDLEQISHILK
jgi:hypothetical protein